MIAGWMDMAPVAAADAIAAWLRARGEPAYRVRQILPRLWSRPVAAWAEATDLPRGVAGALAAEVPLTRPTRAAREISRDGTIKFLWRLADGQAVESVWIPEGRRRTLCLSSQAGCAFGCAFCATGRMGFGRHLTPGEIVAQVREMMLDPALGRPTNVVFMGMGEPLHNWEAVATALTILHDADGLGIGARHITVSTVGVLPGMRALAQRPEPFRIALSLHTPFPEVRRVLMPIERKWPLPDVLNALAAFPRRVTFEYVLIWDRNDRPEDSAELARHAHRVGARVNLLPLHPGGDATLVPAPPARIAAFATALRDAGVRVTVRRSRGLDINAACGQLRVAREGTRVRAEQHAHVE